jgi:N-acetylglucosamine-6-phosphate deacetylase
LRVALSARGLEGGMLVTDAMFTAGSNADHFYLGGQRIHVDGYACRAEDGTLAGSNLNMGAAFANAVDLLKLTPVDASMMASGNPARFLRRDREFGALLPGLRADLVHMSADLKPLKVWLGGQVVQQ